MRNIGIAVFDGIAVFARLRHLNVREKQALRGEVAGKLCIATHILMLYITSLLVCEEVGKLCVATHARIWYICMCRGRMFITRECTEDFTDST